MLTFRNDEYRIAHGASPRGNGSWCFEISLQAFRCLERAGVKLPDISYEDNSYSYQQHFLVRTTGGARSLTEAKQMVRRLFRAACGNGTSFVVEVAP